MVCEPPYTVAIDGDKDGLRLDRVIAGTLPSVSRSRVKSLMAEGCVRIAGNTVVRDPTRAVREGEIYEITVPEVAVDNLAPQSRPLEVVFEDDDIIVVNKPPGLVVHPGAGNPDHTLVNALLAHCHGRLAPAGGSRRPGIVHRLDKDTSGLLVAAKSDAAYHNLVRQFADHSIERAYLALAWGTPRTAGGRIVGSIGRDPKHRKRMAVVARGGKPAATNYRVTQAWGDVISLIECRPETGRTHQIRVHLTSLGHPIVGDPVYGSSRGRLRRLPEPAQAAIGDLGRQALHAFLMGVKHPVTGQPLTLRTNLSHDIKVIVDFLNCV